MGKYPIPIAEREIKYSEENQKKNELLIYFVDPKRLEELYPTEKRDKKNRNEKRENHKGENEKMKINMKIVREELERGLGKDEIAKKYDADLRAVGMLISKVQKQNKEADNEKNESAAQSSPVNIKDSEKAQEKENISQFIIETMDIQGKMFKYRIQGNVITIIKENHSMKIQKSDIDNIVDELQQLKRVIG